MGSKCSVVIANWNRKDNIREALLELRKQTYANVEVIVSDNNSTDGSPDMIEREFPEVRLIRLKRNTGIKGYNIAMAKAGGEIIIILDSDSYLEKGGIEKIVSKFMRFPKLGALGCKVINCCTNEIHYWHPCIRDEEMPEGGFDSPLFNGCAAAVRKTVLDEVGYYPEEYFIYDNERDLCTRIIDAGYDVKYFTDITAYHRVSPQQRSNECLIFYSTRNLIWYYWKYLPYRIAFAKTKLIYGHCKSAGATKKESRIYFKSFLCAAIGLPMIFLFKRKPVKNENVEKILY